MATNFVAIIPAPYVTLDLIDSYAGNIRLSRLCAVVRDQSACAGETSVRSRRRRIFYYLF